MNITQTCDIAAPVDEVSGLLLAREFNETLEARREEVVSCSFVVVDQTDARTIFELRSREYRRKKTGGLDRKKVEESVSRNTWDSARRTLSWDYSGPGTRWVTVSGVYHISPHGDGTRIIHRVTFTVNIPLIGGKIAKMISGEFDEAFDRFQAHLRASISR